MRQTYKHKKYRGSIPENEHEKIKNMYLSGLSAIEIAEIYNVKFGKIYRILQRLNTSRRTNKQNYKPQLNHSYFNSIDSIDKAYWLGLLIADGQVQNLKQSSKIVRLDLIEQDRYILENLAKCLTWTKSQPVKTYNRLPPHSNVARITIFSDEMAKDLAKYNIVPKKTFNTQFPDLKTEYYSHFCRGYFDGDGCITTGPRIKIVGTINLLNSMQKIMMNACNLNKTKFSIRHKDRNNNIRTLEYGGKKQVKRIYEWLYQNANFFLKRKKEKFNELLR